MLLPARTDVDEKLWRYMVHYLRINAVVCSVMAQLSGTPEHLALKEQIWETMDQINPEATERLRKDLLAGLVRHASPMLVRGATRSRLPSSAQLKGAVSARRAPARCSGR